MNTKKITTETTRKTTFGNFTLDGVNTLNVEEITSVYNVIYKFDPETNTRKKLREELESSKTKLVSFVLKETNHEELLKLRKKGVSSFVLKLNDKVYHTKVPTHINLRDSGLVGLHCCSIGSDVCEKLSPAKDDKIGCAKVRNLSKYIELYPWIKKGFETFNTKNDCLVVGKCEHYKALSHTSNLTSAQINKAKLSLAHHIWPDVKNLREARKRREEILKKLSEEID